MMTSMLEFIGQQVQNTQSNDDKVELIMVAMKKNGLLVEDEE